MDIKLDCLPCIFRQALEQSRMSTTEQRLIREILDDYAKLIPQLAEDEIAPAIVGRIHQIIKEKTGVEDPYQAFKLKHMKVAMELVPQVEKAIFQLDNPLLGALIMAASGNAIDAGVGVEIDVEEDIKNAMANGFAHSDFDLFEERLKSVERILIIGDNSGEAVFDKILIKELKEYNVDITYAYREIPVLNDITRKEAIEIGLDQEATIISSGAKTPGMILDQATAEFMAAYQEADLIISKGQGNFEGLSAVQEPIFFLLKAKCKLIAEELNVELGNFVFRYKEEGERLA